VKNDEFEIKVKVAGRLYPVWLKRGDERQEYLIRKAAKKIQQLELEYRQYFVKSLDDRDILAMTAIEIARDLVVLEEKNDTQPFTHKIQQLTNTLEDYLKN
jgi:cell division protein ZapA